MRISGTSFHNKYFTIIDPVNVLFKIVQYNGKHAATLDTLVGSAWLFRYPRPIMIVYYYGNEFFGNSF